MDIKRHKIAFLTAYLEGEDYSEPLWNNLNKYCKELDVDLYIFPGRNIRRDFGHHIVFNELLNFIDTKKFDGVIVASSAMMSVLGHSTVQSYVEKLSNLPIVSIGNHFNNVSSIFIDNAKGMERIFDHLLNEHNIKKIAYLSGPKENEESNQRLISIKKCCQTNGVELLYTNIFYGHFTPDELDIILQPILESGVKDIDAILCANDSMASETIDLLRNNGISVPQDVIITGFDYSRPGKFQKPSVTTISQSLDKIAKEALNKLILLIEKKDNNSDIHVEPTLIISESCGCNHYTSAAPNFLKNNVNEDIYSQYSKSISHLSTRGDHERILTTRTYVELYNVLKEFIVKKGVKSFYLFLYNKYTSKDSLDLLFARCEGVDIDCTSENYSFSENSFIPSKILPSSSQATIVTLPLFSNNMFYGYLIIDVTVPFGMFYEDTQMVISSAISNIVELDDLKKRQKLLVKSEKISFLGDLIASLAHEINTPLGIILTAATHQQDLLSKLTDQFNTESLKKTDLQEFINSDGECLDLILKGLSTTVKLINRFKLISSQSDFEVIQVMNLTEVVKEFIHQIKSESNYQDITFTFNSSGTIIINSYRSVFIQILQTLVHNSQVHGFPGRSDNQVFIDLKSNTEEIVLTYKDNGKGCSESQLPRLFDPFYTTKRYEGQTGLGLTIIYNLTHNKLNGHLEASLKDNALIFTIIIPRK